MGSGWLRILFYCAFVFGAGAALVTVVVTVVVVGGAGGCGGSGCCCGGARCVVCGAFTEAFQRIVLFHIIDLFPETTQQRPTTRVGPAHVEYVEQLTQLACWSRLSLLLRVLFSSLCLLLCRCVC